MKTPRIILACAVLMLMTGCVGAGAVVESTPIPALVPATLPVKPTATPRSLAPQEAALEEPVLAEPVSTEPSPVEIPTPEPFPGLGLPTDRGALFSASGACAICHTRMVDESSNDVSIDTFWRSTMMANASRDPYWQASVREEVLALPQYQAVIEDTCAKCHLPMVRFAVALGGGNATVLDTGSLDTDHEHHELAIDGVSCTLCHQIEENGFGEDDGFSGNFAIDVDLEPGGRLNYGPFRIGQAQAGVMQVASGFIPVQGQHVEQSELCATCHTLYTPYVDAEGEIAGIFPEQTPYLEWQHSSYREAQTCQDCHMPVAQGAVQLSTTGGPPRSPFSKHMFVGGNAYILRVLRAFGKERSVTASSDHFEDKIKQTVDHLQNRTASVALEDVSVSGSQLRAIVSVQSLVGHKFPSGFPARRVWLHFTVQDATGHNVFESGRANPDGSIAGNDNDADPSAYEPHYQVINDPEQVQIYEPILKDIDGRVTTTLLRAGGYIKDNRLLPAGFDKQTAAEDITVFGEAMQDEDFAAGEDVVEYTIDVGDADGPLVVKVELLYQAISYRWVQNLGRHEAPEISRFLEYTDAVPNLPTVVSGARVEVGG